MKTISVTEETFERFKQYKVKAQAINKKEMTDNDTVNNLLDSMED
jgi:hypothetical protein